MTEEQLQEIEEVAAAAAPEPWLSHGHELYYGKDVFSLHQQIPFEPNARFIAFARTWVPRLVDEVRRLQQLVDGLKRDRGHAWMDNELLRAQCTQLQQRVEQLEAIVAQACETFTQLVDANTILRAQIASELHEEQQERR